MNIRCLPRSSIRSSSDCLSTAVIASNLDSRLHLYPEITAVSLVSKTSWFIPPPSLTPLYRQADIPGRIILLRAPAIRDTFADQRQRYHRGLRRGAAHGGGGARRESEETTEKRTGRERRLQAGGNESWQLAELPSPRERRERHNLIVSRLEFAQIRVSKPGE